MAKCADYLISAVRYNNERTQIQQVRVHPYEGDKVGSSSIWSRQQVVSSMEDSQTFCTITKALDGKWKRGADVHIVTVDGEKFLRTDRNAEKADNLGELPEF